MMPPNEISTAPCPVHEVPAPRELSLLFTGPMARASLREVDPKTQTRRVVKPQPNLATDLWEPNVGGDRWIGTGPSPATGGTRQTWGWAPCPYGRPGDRLWVRETFFAWGRWETRFSAKKGRDEWHFVDMTLYSGHAYRYAADGDGLWPMPGRRQLAGATPGWWKRPAIFMPRVASRISLEVTGVRVERLQDISEADAIAEGIERREDGCGDWMHYGDTGLSVDAVGSYRSLWERINGEPSWRANPWVWVVEFRRIVATNSIAARAHGTGAAAAFQEETQ